MRRLLTLNVAVVILALHARGADADPIQLLSFQGGATTDATVGSATGVGSVWMPEYMPLTLDYSSQGGQVEFSGGTINPDPGAGWIAYTEQNYPVNAQFSFNLAALVPGSTDQYQGPELQISETGSGTGPLSVQ